MSYHQALIRQARECIERAETLQMRIHFASGEQHRSMVAEREVLLCLATHLLKTARSRLSVWRRSRSGQQPLRLAGLRHARRRLHHQPWQ